MKVKNIQFLENIKFLTLIFTLDFLIFSVLCVKIRRESEILSTEILFIDMFDHDVQQPSP